MITFLKTMVGQWKTAPPEAAYRPLAQRPCYIIGDIHGRVDLLENLIIQISDDLRTHNSIGSVLVFLGDYVDRGPESAAVLEKLMALENTIDAAVICLMGNHEQMMLDFLDAPQKYGSRWFRNGGIQTLHSFGITKVDFAAESYDFIEIATALRAAMPQGIETWLRELPTNWQSGNIFAAHAGVDPNAPLDSQKPETLIWGHPDFLDRPRKDGKWIAYGHWIIPEASAEDGWISLDTGAYRTGRLSSVAIYEKSVRFITT